jgi:DNA-binding transcriptional regulator YiaG
MGTRKHGQSKTRFYGIWSGIISRCGANGDGISICARWRKFENFFNDMHGAYVEGLQIHRIKNDAGYTPDNCEWLTKREHAAVKRGKYRGAFTMKKTDFSLRITSARRKLDFSQIQAARAWGFSLETLRSWEQGERNPAGLYRAKLEKVLRRIEDR